MIRNRSKPIDYTCESSNESVIREIQDLCHFTKLPDWLKDNEFKHFGHRPPFESFARCFKSVFEIHNETGNIWTHLVGAVIFFIAMIYFYLHPSSLAFNHKVDFEQKIVFLVYFLGAIVCLSMSSIFHTVQCHSEWANSIFSKFDYCGIIFLTVASFVPGLYYAFYCDLVTKVTYFSVIILLGFGTCIVAFWDKFNSAELRGFRAFLFCGLGLFGAIPVSHYIFKHGWWKTYEEASVDLLFIMGLLYVCGACIYAARVPERYLPGKCDLWFHSHQIFHVFVLMASFVFYKWLHNMAHFRISKAGQCSGNETSSLTALI